MTKCSLMEYKERWCVRKLLALDYFSFSFPFSWAGSWTWGWPTFLGADEGNNPRWYQTNNLENPESQDDFMTYSCPASMGLQTLYYKVWEEQMSILFNPWYIFLALCYSSLVLTLINMSISLFVRWRKSYLLSTAVVRVKLHDVHKCFLNWKYCYNVNFYYLCHPCIYEITRWGTTEEGIENGCQ